MLQEIIDELADSNKSLVNPLLKTKILATRLGNKELLKWVNNELNGYNEVELEDIPLYRIARATSSCNIHQGYNSEINVPLPISLIEDEEMRDIFTIFKWCQNFRRI